MDGFIAPCTLRERERMRGKKVFVRRGDAMIIGLQVYHDSVWPTVYFTLLKTTVKGLHLDL